MNHISFMAEVSKKLMSAFSDIGQLCKTYQKSLQSSQTVTKPEKKEKTNNKQEKPSNIEEKAEKPKKINKQQKHPVKVISDKKKTPQTPVKKNSQKKKVVQKSESEQQQNEVASPQKVVEDKNQHGKQKKSNLYADAPKKPMGSYLLYLQQRKPKVQEIFPDLSLTEISQVVGKQWQALSRDQKQNYSKKYEQAKAKYSIELQQYKQIHPDYDEKQKKNKKKQKNNKSNTKKTTKVSVSDEDSQEDKAQPAHKCNSDEDSMGSV